MSRSSAPASRARSRSTTATWRADRRPPLRRAERRRRGSGQAGGVVRDGGGGLPRLAQRPQPDQPRAGARGRHSVLRPRERAHRRPAARRDARRSQLRSGPRATVVRVVVVLFTRDLRVHDNPALATAVEAAETVLPAVRARRRDRQDAFRRSGGPPGVPPGVARRSRRVAPPARRRARRAPGRGRGRDRARRTLGRRDHRLRERRREPVRRRAAAQARGRARPSPRRRRTTSCPRARSPRRATSTTRSSRPTIGLVGGAMGIAGSDTARDPTARRHRAEPRSNRGGLNTATSPAARRRASSGAGVAPDATGRIWHRRPRCDRRRCDIAALALSALRLHLAAGTRRAGSRAGWRCLRAPALLARLLRPDPLRPAADADRGHAQRGATGGSTIRTGSPPGRRG